MPRNRPEPWSDNQVVEVVELLTTFNNDPETVCAFMDCKRDDLNYLCRKAFGPNMTFARVVRKYELVGKAKLKKSLMRAAMDEKPNSKALDFAIREYLEILGPVERRRKAAREAKAKEEETDF